MSTLEDRLTGNSSSVPWIPDPKNAASYGKPCNSDETLIGVVVDHFTRANFNNDGLIDVVVLRLDDGTEVAVHCQATVLASQMKSARPQYGDRIGVKYLGLRTGSGPKPYNDFKVVTERKTGGEIRWAGDPEPQDLNPFEESKRRHLPDATVPIQNDNDDIPF